MNDNYYKTCSLGTYSLKNIKKLELEKIVFISDTQCYSIQYIAIFSKNMKWIHTCKIILNRNREKCNIGLQHMGQKFIIRDGIVFT